MSSDLLTVPAAPPSEGLERRHVLIGDGGCSLYVVSHVWCTGAGPSTDSSARWYFSEATAQGEYARVLREAGSPGFVRLVETEVDAETYELAQMGCEDAVDAIQYAIGAHAIEIEARWSSVCETSSGSSGTPTSVWAVVVEVYLLGRCSRTSTVWVKDCAVAEALFETERSALAGQDARLRLVAMILPPHVARYLPLAVADTARFGTPMADTWAGEQISEWVEAAAASCPSVRVCNLIPAAQFTN